MTLPTYDTILISLSLFVIIIISVVQSKGLRLHHTNVSLIGREGLPLNRWKEVFITAVCVAVINVIVVGIFASFGNLFGDIATKSDITAVKSEILTEIKVIQTNLEHFREDIERVESNQSKDHATLVNHLESHIASNDQ